MSLAYSLDTLARTNLLLTSGDNHIKRVEIVRPGGNSVVFDFAWNSTSGEFGQVGIPVSYNERDSRMLYTLVDLTPGVDTDLAYRMQFTSGITQTFDAATGKLASVGDTNSGLSASAGGSLAIGVDGNPSDPATPRYNIDLKFANGKLSEADYRTTADSPDKIATALTYNSAGSITHLDKTDDAGLSVPDYALKIAGDTITMPGVTILRYQDSATEVEIETDAGDSGSWTDEDTVFNSNGLITSDAVYLSENGSSMTLAGTGYTYQSDTGRYDNGAPTWGKITDISYPDSSVETLRLRRRQRLAHRRLYPIQEHRQHSAVESQDQHYSYDASVSGNGDIADPLLLTERPRETVSSIAGTTTGIAFDKFVGNTITARLAPSASTAWAAAVLGTKTTITGYDTYVQTGPSGKIDHTGTGLKNLNTTTFNERHDLQRQLLLQSFRRTGQRKGKGHRPKHGDRSRARHNRPWPHRFLRPSQVQHRERHQDPVRRLHLVRPTNRHRRRCADTTYTFTDDGRIATKTTPDGLITTYSYDAAGNVTHMEISDGTDGSDQIDISATFDAQGRQTSYTDALGNLTTYSFSSGSSGTTETIAFKASGAALQRRSKRSSAIWMGQRTAIAALRWPRRPRKTRVS